MRRPVGTVTAAGVVGASALLLAGCGGSQSGALGPAVSGSTVASEHAVREASASTLSVATIAQALATAPAEANRQTVREALIGTWKGTYAGYNGGRWESGEQKFVFSSMRGVHVKGTWQYRGKTSGQEWTKPAPVQLIVVPEVDGEDGHWSITGADANGIYVGHLSAEGPRLKLSYQGSVNGLLTYDFTVTRG